MSIRISSTYSAIAGADTRPGDSIPPQCTRPSIFLDAYIMKSPVSGFALTPVNTRMVFLGFRLGTDSFPSLSITASDSASVVVSSTVPILSEVGPIIVFPSYVAVTSTPLPLSVGVWNRTVFRLSPFFLSNSLYTPFVGIMLKSKSPPMLATLSEYKPAAFITYLAW